MGLSKSLLTRLVLPEDVPSGVMNGLGGFCRFTNAGSVGDVGKRAALLSALNIAASSVVSIRGSGVRNRGIVLMLFVENK